MPRNFTTTSINRLFATPHTGIGLLTTVRSNGAYDSDPSSYMEIWVTYSLSEPNTFNHEDDFTCAVETLMNSENDFLIAVSADPVGFAQAVSIAHGLGRVISNNRLWDELAEISHGYRSLKIRGDLLQFHTYESKAPNFPEIVEYEYDIRCQEIRSRTVRAALTDVFRSPQN